MALEHEFAIIEEKRDIDEVRESKEMVKVPDFIIQYVTDTFRWVDTFWNDGQKKCGLDYYGNTIIKGSNIEKFEKIIDSWLKLFGNAPDRFYIEGNYLLDENRYEKIELDKKKVLLWLRDLQKMCNRAIQEKKMLLHIGI